MKKLLLALAILFIFPSAALAQSDEPAKKFSIKLTLSGNNTSRLTDGNVSSYLSLPKGEQIFIECGGACGLMLKWHEATVYQVTAYTAEEQENIEYDNSILNQYIPLNGADRVQVDVPYGGKLSDIIFFESKTDDTQVWEAPYEKSDILVIAAHPDDEYLYMGGTIPFYGKERGLRVTVAWMSHQRRLRQDEALAALWAMGVRHYPEFVGFPDRYSDTYADGARNWGEKATLGAIVRLYRKYRPEAVVTHDLKGEYGHGAHRLTAAMALKAAEAAADETQFPESAKEYGAWQIKKLYLHLYKENAIVMDWNQPLETFEGNTALEMAKIGYSYHKSQHRYSFSVSDTSRHSCAKFGLAFTAVGPDVVKNDFLENIPAECLSDYVAPEPVPTIAPSCKPVILIPEPTKEPSPEPSIECRVTESPAAPPANKPDAVIVAVGAALFGVIIFTVCILLKRKRQ